MGWLDRLFGRKRTNDSSPAVGEARRRDIVGREPGQSADEQAATRQRMESEMNAQRERRTAPPPTDA
jgi:hypothetical protein